MDPSRITPVILSGGSGTRLWPLSRSHYPKQFIPGLNRASSSLFASTLNRLLPEHGFQPPIVVCNGAHRFLVREATQQANLTPQAILLEPEGRNTAPAIAVAALAAAARNPAALLCVMPSDHIIHDTSGFRAAVETASDVADGGRVVLFGIQPTEPHTGYGYIQRGTELEGGGYDVAAFVEKPDLETASRYVREGNYLWNGGIFVFRCDVFLEELAAFDAAILRAAGEALAGASEDLGFVRLHSAAFRKSPSVSVDCAVMEKTAKAAVLPLTVDWSDLGSWTSLWQAASHDADGNFVQGDALLEDTNGCYIRAESSLIATIGVENLIVVETKDTVLIANKGCSERVSGFVKRLKDDNRRECEQHLRSYRPWGFFETLNIGSRFQVKLLHVNPGGILSLQMHHHRSEHWVVVQGTARVTIDGKQSLVKENESVYIVATQWHRLENPGKVPLELIEVQLGSYLGEDDIIRGEDVYNRSPEETR